MSKIALITGASSGIGLETARFLHEKGWEVILVAKLAEELNLATQSFQKSNNQLSVYACDLSLISERNTLAETLQKNHPTIDLLVLNAGAVFSDFEVNADGLEQTIALNYFGYFHLGLLLLPALQASAAGQIVCVSSRNHFWGDISFESFTHSKQLPFVKQVQKWLALPIKQKILFALMGEHMMRSYAQSKLAVILFANTFARKYRHSGILINSFHPGVVKTAITHQNTSPLAKLFWKIASAINGISARQSATYLYAMIENVHMHLWNGEYVELDQRCPSSAQSYNEQLQEELWKYSILKINLGFKE